MDPAAQTHPYESLTPDVVMNALEASGIACSGHLLALNSYENRVYQVGLDDDGFLVTKFYRPERWSDATILEEHAFALQLAADEIPVVPPLVDSGGGTLHRYGGFRFALYERKGGHAPALDNPAHLEWLGRFIGRLHAVGATGSFAHRPVIEIERMGHASRAYLLEHDWIPPHLLPAYESVSAEALDMTAAVFARTKGVQPLRLHGDCHPGNILWTDAGPHIVDLDDCCTGPAIQDLWMLLSGDRDDMSVQLQALLTGYTAFYDFDAAELALIEALRILRMMHYTAWLARRWQDPAFPRSFPWFDSPRYWEEHVLHLREQIALLQEPPLQWRTL